MKYSNIIVASLLAVGVSGCNNDSTESSGVTEIFIDHYKSECFGFALSLCMRSKLNIDDDWKFFYNSIEGFEYEWGYTYKLKVDVENIENPPEDSSSLKYTLIEVLSKEQESSTTTFDLAVSRAPNLVTNVTPEIISSGIGVYEVYGEKKFFCTDEECSSVDSLVSQDMAIIFEFTHNSNPSEPLSLSQIKCSSSRESFQNSCL